MIKCVQLISYISFDDDAPRGTNNGRTEIEKNYYNQGHHQDK